MKYSEEFKVEMKELYPNNKQMALWLDEDNEKAMKTLQRDYLEGIKFQEILSASSLEDLQKKVHELKLPEKHKLYWENI